MALLFDVLAVISKGTRHCMKPAPAKTIQNVRGVSCPWMLKFDALQETSAVATA